MLMCLIRIEEKESNCLVYLYSKIEILNLFHRLMMSILFVFSPGFSSLFLILVYF